MGYGMMLMNSLIIKHHVGYCRFCRVSTAFILHNGGVYTCPVCNRFGTPFRPTDEGD
jgi:hypothetical protein